MTDDERRELLYVTLRDHLDALWQERDRRLEERWRAQEDALRKALASMDRRLDLLNELRENVLNSRRVRRQAREHRRADPPEHRRA